jgi:hypothetical protein
MSMMMKNRGAMAYAANVREAEVLEAAKLAFCK